MATTRQLVLTAGKIMDMNLDTYKAVCKYVAVIVILAPCKKENDLFSVK